MLKLGTADSLRNHLFFQSDVQW